MNEFERKQGGVAVLIESGLTPIEADIVWDVADHAATEGMLSSSAVFDTVTPALVGPVMILTARMLEASAAHFIKQATFLCEKHEAARSSQA